MKKKRKIGLCLALCVLAGCFLLTGCKKAPAPTPTPVVTPSPTPTPAHTPRPFIQPAGTPRPSPSAAPAESGAEEEAVSLQDIWRFYRPLLAWLDTLRPTPVPDPPPEPTLPPNVWFDGEKLVVGSDVEIPRR